MLYAPCHAFLKSAIRNREPARRVGVRRTNPISHIPHLSKEKGGIYPPALVLSKHYWQRID